MSASHPFATEEDLVVARQLLAGGKAGREIAAAVDAPLGRVAEWVVREREAAR